MTKLAALAFAALALSAPGSAMAQETLEAGTLNSGDTAWILVSSALVLLMCMPGLTLFYGGLMRAKNFLSIMVQVGAIAALASVLWVICG